MLEFKIEHDEKKCEKLWEQCSLKKDLWDLWEFRRCFHPKNAELHFIAGYEKSELVGLLPLYLDLGFDLYLYFGTLFPENNRMLIEDRYVADILAQAPQNTELHYLANSEGKRFPFKQSDKRFFLDLGRFKEFEDYLGTFNKKHRKNFRYDLKKLDEAGFTIARNDVKDFELMVGFSKEQFGKDSDYHEAGFEDSMRNVMNLAKKRGILELLSVRNKKTEAVGIGVVFNRTYMVLSVGRNPAVGNVGKMLISAHIKRALELRCKEIDFLTSEGNWKELWNLQSEDLFEYVPTKTSRLA